MRDVQQKVTQLEKANRSHVDIEELQVQVSFSCRLLISLVLFNVLSKKLHIVILESSRLGRGSKVQCLK